MSLLLSTPQLWALVIGAIVPLGGYVLNAKLPFVVSEPVKAIVQVLLVTIATALYTALETHVFGFNASTLELVVTGVVGLLGAHNFLWKPAKVNAILGATELDSRTPVVSVINNSPDLLDSDGGVDGPIDPDAGQGNTANLVEPRNGQQDADAPLLEGDTAEQQVVAPEVDPDKAV